MSLRYHGVQLDELENIIRIDPDAEYLLGDDQMYNCYPCRFPTVDFQLLDTVKLDAIGDEIRKGMGFRPLYEEDGEDCGWYDWYIGLNGHADSKVDPIITFIVANSSSEDDEKLYEITLSADEQKEIYRILNRQCRKLYGKGCDELLEEARMAMAEDGVDTEHSFCPDCGSTRNPAVDHPDHYNADGYEVLDVIAAFKLDFLLGNALKYICRCGRKPGADATTDLKKAVFYLNRKIEEVEGAPS